MPKSKSLRPSTRAKLRAERAEQHLFHQRRNRLALPIVQAEAMRAGTAAIGRNPVYTKERAERGSSRERQWFAELREWLRDNSPYAGAI